MNKEYSKMYVGNGWHSLVDEAFDLAEKENFSIFNVKETHGMLRIYTDGEKDHVDKIADIEIRSMTICECCGSKASPRVINTQIKTVCDICKDIYNVLVNA